MTDSILIVEDDFIIATDLRQILERAGYKIAGIAPSVTKALELIEAKKPSWVFLDIYLVGKLTGIDLAKQLVKMKIPFIYISANSNQSILEASKATKPFGFLVKPFREKDVLITFDVAKYRYENDFEAKLLQEFSLQEQVMEIIASFPDKEQKMLKIIAALQTYIPFNYLSIYWQDNANRLHDGKGFLRINNNDFVVVDREEALKKIGKTKKDSGDWKKCIGIDSSALFFTGTDFIKMCDEHLFDKYDSQLFQLSSVLLKTIRIADCGLLTFSLYSRNATAYDQEQVVLLDRLGLLLSKIADCIPELESFNKNNTYSSLPGDPSTTRAKVDGLGLIGKNVNFELIKEQLAIVAPFDISVLILGESGTGKEKIAQAIHKLSYRAAKPLVRINCGAIPATLIESELFGHEKGAFTGAHDHRIGKFEQANGGTIFLDEIGELPMELQVKLLSVLQEKEIVRVGGNEVIPTDVRVIAATNKNLEKEIADGRFRLDLYYRLNIFPILLPPLRERKDDLPELANYFLAKLSKKMDRTLMTISPPAMNALTNYDWPGNIRELENIIERSMVLSDGKTIENIVLPDLGFEVTNSGGAGEKIKTIKELEKEHIQSVLKKCNGKVAGAGGAAQLLDLSPTTLVAKMKKFGIVKDFF